MTLLRDWGRDRSVCGRLFPGHGARAARCLQERAAQSSIRRLVGVSQPRALSSFSPLSGCRRQEICLFAQDVVAPPRDLPSHGLQRDIAVALAPSFDGGVVRVIR